MHKINPGQPTYPSTTTTTSTTNAPHLVATLTGEKQAPHIFDCQEEIDKISDIMWAYKDWKDPLSKDMSRWGVDLFKLRDVPENELVDAALHMVDTLQKKILVNPLDYVNHSPLEEPVLERQWTWEKSWLEKWPLLDGTGISPFDKLPMQATKPHFFAIKMLNWLHSLPLTSNQPPLVIANNPTNGNAKALICPTTALSATTLDRSAKMVISFLVKKAATTYATVANVRDTRYEMAETAELAEKLTEQTKQMIAEETEQLKEEMKAHEKKLDERIENIEVNHDGTVKVLDGQIKDGLAKLVVLKKEKDEIKEKADSLENENKGMRGTIASLQGQLGAMQGGGGGGGGCTIF
jgi:hypothetical protein